MQMERWLSVDEIARESGADPDAVDKCGERGKRPAHKVGRL